MIAGKAQFRCMTATATMSRVNVVSADLTQILLDLDAINGEVIGTTAAEKTDKIEATKLAIETAIEAANVDVPAGTVFADYADYVAQVRAETCFAFSAATKSIYKYNVLQGGEAIVIPSSIGGVAVETIAPDGCRGFTPAGTRPTSAFISDSVKSIGNSAFRDNSLKSVRISTNALLTTFGTSIFEVNLIAVITIPANITAITAYFLYGNPTVEITIGAGVTITAGTQAMGTQSAGFESLYNGNGKLAGTYKYAAGTWSKTA